MTERDLLNVSSETGQALRIRETMNSKNSGLYASRQQGALFICHMSPGTAAGSVAVLHNMGEIT